ncbi:MAG: hypothetical protein FWD46_06085 [Cystobacterineae bacterium]|nr:hypothetical protein [Cystobacterineae bacterium]
MSALLEKAKAWNLDQLQAEPNPLGLQPAWGLRLQTELEQRMAAFWGTEDAFYSALPSPLFHPLLELAKNTWLAEPCHRAARAPARPCHIQPMSHF